MQLQNVILHFLHYKSFIYYLAPSQNVYMTMYLSQTKKENPIKKELNVLHRVTN